MKNILLIQSSPRASESYSQRVADSIVNEIKDRNPSTDIVVLAVPMHNFGIPSTLKAWIDHVVRVEGAAMSAIGADKAVATAHSREILARAARTSSVNLVTPTAKLSCESVTEMERRKGNSHDSIRLRKARQATDRHCAAPRHRATARNAQSPISFTFGTGTFSHLP
jgi:hypothetical protein